MTRPRRTSRGHAPAGTGCSSSTTTDRSVAEAVAAIGEALARPGYPDFGWVVPGGTREPGESAEACLRREVLGEAGRDDLNVGPMLKVIRYGEIDRYFYPCTLARPCRDAFVHVATGRGSDAVATVHDSWLAVPLPVLGGRLSDALHDLLAVLGRVGP